MIDAGSFYKQINCSKTAFPVALEPSILQELSLCTSTTHSPTNTLKHSQMAETDSEQLATCSL